MFTATLNRLHVYRNFWNIERWKSLINSLQTIISCRNFFQNVVNALLKIVDSFLSKRSKFNVVWSSDNVLILL